MEWYQSSWSYCSILLAQFEDYGYYAGGNVHQSFQARGIPPQQQNTTKTNVRICATTLAFHCETQTKLHGMSNRDKKSCTKIQSSIASSMYKALCHGSRTDANGLLHAIKEAGLSAIANTYLPTALSQKGAHGTSKLRTVGHRFRATMGNIVERNDTESSSITVLKIANKS